MLRLSCCLYNKCIVYLQIIARPTVPPVMVKRTVNDFSDYSTSLKSTFPNTLHPTAVADYSVSISRVLRFVFMHRSLLCIRRSRIQPGHTRPTRCSYQREPLFAHLPLLQSLRFRFPGHRHANETYLSCCRPLSLCLPVYLYVANSMSVQLYV